MRAVASRRGFLRGIATVSAVAGTVAAPYVVRAAPQEDAELSRLDADLAAAAARYLECAAAHQACVARFDSIKPSIPADLIRPACADYRLGHDWPQDADGTPRPSMFDHRVSLYGRWHLQDQSSKVDGRTRYGKMVRRLHRLSERYHAEHLDARIASGVRDAERKRFDVGRTVTDLGFAIMSIEATSMTGLAVKGRAGLAMHRVWKDEHGRHIEDSYGRLLRNLATVQGAEIPLCA